MCIYIYDIAKMLVFNCIYSVFSGSVDHGGTGCLYMYMYVYIYMYVPLIELLNGCFLAW